MASDLLLDPETVARIREQVRTALAAGVSGAAGDAPAAALRAVASAAEGAAEADRLLRQAVTRAREEGHGWDAIGSAVGVSEAGAKHRFGGSADVPEVSERVPETTLRRINGATAFNEMAILRREGRRGWHLVGFGPLYLEVEHSPEQWEHLRVALEGPDDRRALLADGWQFVGTWTLWTYYTRPTGKPAHDEH